MEGPRLPVYLCTWDLIPKLMTHLVILLTITVTREEFENKVYTFRCITFDSFLGFINDPNKVISNEVTVDPPGESV